MMDFASLGLSGEALEKAQAAYEQDVAGLKAKNEELINEKKTAQQLADEASQAVADKQKALQLAEEEKLKIKGDQDELKAFYEKQNAEALAKAQEQATKAQGLILERDTNEAKAVVLAKVDPNFKDFADALLTQNLTVTYNDKGEVVKEFKTDNGVVGSETEFLSWASEKSETWKRVLIAANSSGGGAQQSSAPGGKMSDKERIKQKYNLSS